LAIQTDDTAKDGIRGVLERLCLGLQPRPYLVVHVVVDVVMLATLRV
jgi:hypothetical protein